MHGAVTKIIMGVWALVADSKNFSKPSCLKVFLQFYKQSSPDEWNKRALVQWNIAYELWNML
jgi:hypothetical protein